MNGGKYLMYSLYLSKGRSAGGKGQRADPGVFLIKRSSVTAKKDGFIIARSSYEDGRGLAHVFSPAPHEVLNVLQKTKQLLTFKCAREVQEEKQLIL